MTCLGVVTAPPRAGFFSFASTEHNLPMLARAIAVLLILAPTAAHAHGGHHNRKAGGYHCHRGVLAGRSFESKAEAVLALRDKLPPHRPGSTEPPTNTRAPQPSDKTIVAKPYGLDDGDTYILHVRAQGIDTPEKRQLCERADGSCYACGKARVKRCPT